MITPKDKELLTEWLSMNLQMTSKSNVELIVSHVDRYFQSPPVEAAGVKELIEAAKYGYEFHQKTQFPDGTFEDVCLNNFKQHLSTLPQQDSGYWKQRWISVEERLPELETYPIDGHGNTRTEVTKTVIVYDAEEDEVFPESYSKLRGFNQNKAVTHWMPLPEPPKQQG